MGAAVAEKSVMFDQIRTVAGDLFSQAGYKGMGMRSLAAAVGIQVGSLYNHIESKQALLFELISDYELNLLQILKSRALSKCTGPVQMNAHLWEKVSAYVSESRNLAKLARAELRHLSDAQASSISEIRQHQQVQLHRLVSQSAGEVGLSDEGLGRLSEELQVLLDCFIKLEADPSADPTWYVRGQLKSMAAMLLVRRD